jgi:uncharacterized membrane protein
MDASHIADDLLTASTALAGLILVFVGNAASGYDSYDATQQHAVKRKYQKRGWFGFAGFTAALLSAVSALAYTLTTALFLVCASGSFLLISLVIVWIATFIQVREIK